MPNTDLKIGTLLRVKEHCRKSRSARDNGEYGILVNGYGKYLSHDVLFPNGQRVIFVEANWEVVSDVGQ